MRVLILNSDSPKNRGDRAILAGLIEVVRKRWPDSEILSLSQYKDRDEGWFGIHFLPQSPYSISPFNYLRLLRAARQADVILWGGGEILKDYTNRLGLLYWALKVGGISLVNHEIFGAFQGIGPTTALSSRRLIAYTVNRTRGFVVRDELSATRLADWGVKVPITSSFDPAIIAPVASWTNDLEEKVKRSLDVSGTFFENVVGIGVRPWFHYKQGGWLPFSLRGGPERTSEFLLYRDRLVEVVDHLTSDRNANVLFIPMHVSKSEGDDGLANDIINRMQEPCKARVLDEDSFSPSELSAVIGKCRYVVSSRLHSAILSASARVPALVLYYVDKGRLFYEQLGMQEFALPIETLLQEDGVDVVLNALDRLSVNRDHFVKVIDRSISRMTEELVADALKGWPVD